ncbi:MAG: MTH938/NDUFAF3 family protein [Woeseiaceae bacterium]|nr:MTH938/NDUFAF3 family protein [Woeseiaceae bacterium]
MKFTRELATSLSIRRVTDDGFVIGEDSYDGAVALTGERVLDDWPQTAIADLVEDHFAPLLSGEIEVILLGTGTSNIFPPRELVFAMARRGVGFEVMDTRAAARTFNVLAGEGRRVAAVLYL